MNREEQKVAYWTEEGFEDYLCQAPYHPSEQYPEYFGEVLAEENNVYGIFRKTLYQLGLDESHFGMPEWNPFGEIIKSGDAVVIKPNLVLHENRSGENIYSVITHPAVIRAAVDYAYIALQGKGKITIADAPQADADFEQILKITKLNEIADFYHNQYDFDIDIVDLRKIRFEYRDGVLVQDSRIEVDGDPLGYTIYDLKNKSHFVSLDNADKIYGADYDRKELLNYHHDDKHEYCISNTVIKADVIITIPKMKTHRKSGITLCLKNFIGINGDKNYLPHFRIGDAADGGDEFEKLDKKTKIVKYVNRFLIDHLLVHPNKFKSFIYENIFGTYKRVKASKKNLQVDSGNMGGGGWYGNDTLWRTILDLCYILMHGSEDGTLQENTKRRIFCVVDGLIAGEGNGPLASKEKHTGTLVMGENPLAVDLVTARLMGMNYKNLKLYNNAVKEKLFQFDVDNSHINVQSNKSTNFDWQETGTIYFEFEEADGWKSRIRIKKEEQ